jgi:hypothetical protein
MVTTILNFTKSTIHVERKIFYYSKIIKLKIMQTRFLKTISMERNTCNDGPMEPS